MEIGYQTERTERITQHLLIIKKNTVYHKCVCVCVYIIYIRNISAVMDHYQVIHNIKIR